MIAVVGVDLSISYYKAIFDTSLAKFSLQFNSKNIVAIAKQASRIMQTASLSNPLEI